MSSISQNLAGAAFGGFAWTMTIVVAVLRDWEWPLGPKSSFPRARLVGRRH